MFTGFIFAVALLAAGQGEPAQPHPSPARHVAGTLSDADYPPEAMALREQGTTTMRIAVDASGTVTGCTIAASSGSAALDATSCRLARERFRFAPATDADGRAVASTLTRRIAWQLPADPEPAPAASSAGTAFGSFQLVVTATLQNGAIAACTQQDEAHPAQPGPQALCENVFGRLLEWAAARPDVTQLTQVIAFVRDGDAAPAAAEQWGTTLIRAEADIELGADGRNTRCMISRQERGPGAEGLETADPCTLSGGAGASLFGASTTPDPRRGRTMIATFVRRGG